MRDLRCRRFVDHDRTQRRAFGCWQSPLAGLLSTTHLPTRRRGRMPASPALERPSCWLAGREKEKTVCVVSEGWGREGGSRWLGLCLCSYFVWVGGKFRKFGRGGGISCGVSEVLYSCTWFLMQVWVGYRGKLFMRACLTCSCCVIADVGSLMFLFKYHVTE